MYVYKIINPISPTQRTSTTSRTKATNLKHAITNTQVESSHSRASNQPTQRKHHRISHLYNENNI